MTAKEYIESFADYNRLWDPSLACQAYVIALGVNDLYWSKHELGDVSDINREEPGKSKDTFAGYYGQIICRLKQTQPQAKFFFVTMPNEGTSDEIKTSHRDLLYKMADFFENSYVLDIYKYGPVYDAEFKDKFFLYGHMNPSGYIFTANMIDAYIDYIVRHNPDDFRRVPFIGSNLK